MMNSLISVIIPVFNTENYIRECVESIINQSYKNLEIIIVDDGSQDASIAKISDLLVDDRIEVIRQNNQGLSAARNAGIKKSSGDYICFVDSDDIIPTEALFKLITVASENNADLVFGDYSEIDEQGNGLPDNTVNGHKLSQLDIEKQTAKFKEGLLEVKDLLPLLTNTFLDHYSINLVVAWNKLIKREIAESNLFAIGKKHEDEFWIMPLLLSCNKIAYMQDIVYRYRIRNNSLMRSNKVDYDVEMEVLDAYEARILLAQKNNLNERIFVKSYFNNISNMHYRFIFNYGLSKCKCRKILWKKTKYALPKYGKYLSLREKLKFIF